MSSISDSIALAIRDLRAPRVLAVMLLPPLGALIAWAALSWAFADDWARWARDFIAGSTWLSWVASWGLDTAVIWGSGIAAAAVLLPLVFITAVLVTELVVMPVVVPWVAQRRFPGLEEKKGGSVAGGVLNAAGAVAVFLALWVVTLPLWFTGIGALLLPPLLTGHLNQRLFRYDALAEHATREEYRGVLARARGRLFLLGWLLALLFYIPVVNLAAPVLSALAFTHFCLAELAVLRGEAANPAGRR